jgi:transcriptional regulator with XRE-family HTH domain
VTFEEGQRIKARRLSLGLTQKQLGERAMCASRSLNYIEFARHSPSYGTMKAICRELGLDLETLEVKDGHK